MKKFIFVLIALFILLTGNCLANNYPSRYAKGVLDVSVPYNSDDWIIKPTEEAQDDNRQKSPLECDIKEVLSCYDEDNLRVDILLHNPVTLIENVFYVVMFEYENMDEFYMYFPIENICMYGIKINGSLVKSQILNLSISNDRFGITSTKDIKNNNVYFILDKNKHIGGEKGQRLYLNTQFYSGFVDSDSEKLIISDETLRVNLFFKK